MINVGITITKQINLSLLKMPLVLWLSDEEFTARFLVKGYTIVEIKSEKELKIIEKQMLLRLHSPSYHEQTDRE